MGAFARAFGQRVYGGGIDGQRQDWRGGEVQKMDKPIFGSRRAQLCGS